MSNHTINKKIREILGNFGIKNYSEAKIFLQNKDMNRFKEF